MKKLTASLLSAALVASLAISGSAFASGTQRSAGDATDGTWDYPRENTTATAPSQYLGGSSTEGPASYAVDGDTSTYWHSNWDENATENGSVDLSNTPDQRYIQLTLNDVATLDGLRYLPRPATGDGGSNGRVTAYRIEVSTTGTDEEGAWKKVATGTWESNPDWKIAEFEPVDAQYVRLYGTTTEGAGSQGNMYMSCAELRVQVAQEEETTNIFLGKDARASTQLTNQEADKANDGNPTTQWCANWESHTSPNKDLNANWWQVDLGDIYHVEQLNLVFEQSSTWQYHVAVSDDAEFTGYTFDETGVTTVTAAQTTADVIQTGRYVRVYVKSTVDGRWPCLREVSGTGTVVTTPEVTKEEVQALVDAADKERAEWYKSGWEDYAQAIEAAKVVLAEDAPTAEDLANAKQAIETAKEDLVEREQYTAADPFVFPGQDKTATLEAEFAQLNDVVLESDKGWALQVAQNVWASHGEYINCLNQQDTITFYYDAPVAGTYSVKAFYRSGSGSNALAWSGENVQEGTVTAGATDEAAETHTVTFNLVITKAGAGTLVFTGPDTKSPQLDKLEITLTEATYPITVNNPSEGGTATANPTTAAAGDRVTLTPVASEGYHFVEWQVDREDVEITDNTFTMPESAVTITPVFEAHTYGEPTFAWTDDNTSVTATFTCDREDCGHQETATAQATSAVTKQPTCTEKGVTTYTATVTVDFGEGTYTSTKDVQDIPAVAHTYGEPVFTWAEDGKSASATFTCACGDEHEETAVITHEVKTPATCTEKGTTTYTATVTVDFGEGTYTSTKDVQDIPALGHSYGQPTFAWAEDGKSASATFICGNCQDEQTVEATITSEVKTEATCTEKGTTTYTATVEFGEKSYTDTKDVTDLPATGHHVTLVEGKAATCTEAGTKAYYVCGDCKAAFEDKDATRAIDNLDKWKVIPATGHKFVDGVCTVCGEKDPNYVPPTQEPQGDVVLDNNTDNQITAGNASEVFEANTVITVESVTQGEIYNTVKEALKGVVADMKNTAILDITATLNGKPVQPSAPVQMTFAIPRHLSADNLKLFYVSDDGKTTQEIPITVDKDARTVTATIAHFSTYVLANVVVDETTGTVPPTGDASQLMLMTGMLLTSAAALGGLVVASRKRRG